MQISTTMVFILNLEMGYTRQGLKEKVSDVLTAIQQSSSLVDGGSTCGVFILVAHVYSIMGLLSCSF